jgi:hypothetical protein
VRQFSSNEVRILEIQQKFTNWSQFLVLYFENNADQAEVMNFNNLHTILQKLSHSLDFLFTIKIRPLHLDWHNFRSTLPKLGPDWSIFVSVQRLARHFDDNCLTNLNLFSKSKLDYPSSNYEDFSELDCVYTMNFSLGGGKVVLHCKKS